MNSEHDDVFEQLKDLMKRFDAQVEEEEHIAAIKQCADTIASLIVTSDSSLEDIASEKTRLRELIERFFPEKMYLYDLLFESRFKRLWEQFRE
jgi:hypothetical protein